MTSQAEASYNIKIDAKEQKYESRTGVVVPVVYTLTDVYVIIVNKSY